MDAVHLGRLGDLLVGTVGDAAASVADARRGLRRRPLPAGGLVLAAGLLAGYLIARARRAA
ncbi:hypothetical protein D7147_06550 [Micromonospora musae]|uniref:DUF3618 domain-containing protein n=1 Tax=Micromonospora musae TaxID=1894970 RepID=A0ABX9RF48_9ACTN|nr:MULTISPECIES: hypothetical protein [Micromonospora]RKN22339.1 hypothetical protein D7147_06550 [Micromonospora musae]TYB97744.1 hypothetical protein FXF53_19195 [Micromonospora sp. WP24]